MQINTEEAVLVRAASETGRTSGHATRKNRRGAGVVLRGLTKRYAGRTVLGKIDLRIAPGEFVAVIGRSGCGKSTLLRLIAGLEQADEGGIVVEAEEGSGGVRLMFQEARLLPWKTVLENVALGLHKGKEQARTTLDAVGLATRAEEWPAVLSGGQRQRVALARALVHAPQLLLLDEPLGALDALTRIEMQALVESLWRERGFGAVLVTHDVQEALALADRVLVVEDGRIAHDVAVPLVRPRQRGSAEFAALERRLLGYVLDGRA